jgi:integrase
MKRKSPFPRYTNNYRDRHGKLRSDFRRGAVRVALPEPLLGPGYWEAYQQALADYVAGREPGARSKVGANRVQAGTVLATFVVYTGSADFKTNLAASTQRAHIRMLRPWADKYATARIRQLKPQHVAGWVAGKAKTPAAAREFLKALRRMMAYLVAIGELDADPTQGVKPPKLRGAEIPTWSEDAIALYRAHHAFGTMPRLSFELLLGTAQRRSDVVKMGRQHVRNGAIHVVQQKTGAVVDVPILPELARAIEAMPASSLTFIINKHGKPYTPESFGEVFREWCTAAGVPKGLTAHGLRKACATRLAEATGDPFAVMAVTGHKTLAEAERYTRAIRRERLAHDAMTKLATRIDEPNSGFVKSG